MAEAKRLDTTEKARLFSLMLEKKLHCPVCKKLLNPEHHPVKFPDCGHMCCEDCFHDIVEDNPGGEVRCPKCDKIWTTFGAYKEQKVKKTKPKVDIPKSKERFSYIAIQDDNESDSDRSKSDSDTKSQSDDDDESRNAARQSEPRSTTPGSNNENDDSNCSEPTDFQSRRRMIENGIKSRSSVQARRIQLTLPNLDRNRPQSQQDRQFKKSPREEQKESLFPERNSLIKKSPREEHKESLFPERNNNFDEHVDRTYKGRPKRAVKMTPIGINVDNDDADKNSSKPSDKPAPSVLPKPKAAEATGLKRQPLQTKPKPQKSDPHFAAKPLRREKDGQIRLGPSANITPQGSSTDNDEKKSNGKLPRTDLHKPAGISLGNRLSGNAYKLTHLKKCKTPLHLKLAHKFGEFECAMSIAASNKDWIVVADFEGNTVTTFQKQRDGSYKKYKNLNLNASGNPFKPIDVAVTHDGNILVTRGTGIEIYSSSGKLNKTIESKDSEAEVHSVTALADGTILAGDIGTSVINEYSSSGKLRRTIKLTLTPYHIYPIRNTHVAVCDPGSDLVAIVDLKSEELRQILIPKAQGICYNEPTGGILIVRNSYKVNKRGEDRAIPGTGVIEQYCPATGAWVHDLEEGLRYPSDLCFTSDGMLAVADKKNVALYDVTWHS